MTAGRKEKTGPPPPPESRPEDEGLVTSDDLFGDLVDGPLPPGQSGGGVRSEPIRVQVNDPVSPAPFAVPEPPPAGTDAEVESAFDRLGTSPGKDVVFRPATPVFDDAEARLPPSALRTGAKLMVTDPKIP
ncbi:MAG TPA: hypothetical protein VLA62_00160, partial [Solirubrobacterales bacterium]|nr:hypothetical protein [Solirubrobacterales bacterium]